MKLIIFALFITAACVSAENEVELSPEGLAQILKLKCERKSGPNAIHELEVTVRGARECLREVEMAMGKHRNIEDFQQFCDDFANSHEIYECVTPVGAKLEACLDEEESFLPDFLYGAFNHTVQEYCKPGGLSKYAYLLNTVWSSGDCFSSVNMELFGKTCFPDLAIFKSANNLDGNTFIVKESEICSDMVNFQTCAINFIKEQCSGADHSKFVHYLMEPYLSWCAQHHA